MSLIILVPSRGRAQQAHDFLANFNATKSLETTSALFVVDDDDPSADDYPESNTVMVPALLDAEGKHVRGCVYALNRAAQMCLTVKTAYLGFMGDDHRPRTHGWDAAYVAALQAGAAVVWGDDLLQGEAFPTQVALDARIVKTLGYFAPPSFKHLCVDLVWKDWGQGLDRLKYLPEVIVEHVHPAAGKAELDQGYIDANAHNSVDSAEYYRWKEHDLPGELARLRTAFS